MRHKQVPRGMGGNDRKDGWEEGERENRRCKAAAGQNKSNVDVVWIGFDDRMGCN